jgi:hypothetical protein
MSVINLQEPQAHEFWKLAETLGNWHAYVDIVGVTGSIPVAPTTAAPAAASTDRPGILRRRGCAAVRRDDSP